MSAPTTETSIQVSMYITAMAIPPSPVCSPLIDVGLRSLPSHSSSPSPANSPQIKHIPQASRSTLNGSEVLKRSSRGFDRRPGGFFRLEYWRECRQPHHIEHNLVVRCESHQQDPLIRFPCFADESNDGRDAGAIQISDLSEIEHDMRCACRQRFLIRPHQRLLHKRRHLTPQVDDDQRWGVPETNLEVAQPWGPERKKVSSTVYWPASSMTFTSSAS